MRIDNHQVIIVFLCLGPIHKNRTLAQAFASFRGCEGCLRDAHVYQSCLRERFRGASDKSVSSARRHYSVAEAGEDEAAAGEAVQEGEAACKEAV